MSGRFGSTTRHNIEVLLKVSGIPQLQAGLNQVSNSSKAATGSVGGLTKSLNQIPISAGAGTRATTSLSGSLGNLQKHIGPVQGGLTSSNTVIGNTTKELGKFEAQVNKTAGSMGGLAEKFSRNRGLTFALFGIGTASIEAAGSLSMLGDMSKAVAEQQQKVNDLIAAGKQGTEEYDRAVRDLQDTQRGYNFILRNTLLSVTDILPFLLLTVNGLTKLKTTFSESGTATSSFAKITDSLSGIFKKNNTETNIAKGNIASLSSVAKSTAGGMTTLATSTTAATGAVRGLSTAVKGLLIGTGVGAIFAVGGIIAEGLLSTAEAATQAGSTTENAFDKISKAYFGYEVQAKSSVKNVDEVLRKHVTNIKDIGKQVKDIMTKQMIEQQEFEVKRLEVTVNKAKLFREGLAKKIQELSTQGENGASKNAGAIAELTKQWDTMNGVVEAGTLELTAANIALLDSKDLLAQQTVAVDKYNQTLADSFKPDVFIAGQQSMWNNVAQVANNFFETYDSLLQNNLMTWDDLQAAAEKFTSVMLPGPIKDNVMKTILLHAQAYIPVQNQVLMGTKQFNSLMSEGKKEAKEFADEWLKSTEFLNGKFGELVNEQIDNVNFEKKFKKSWKDLPKSLRKKIEFEIDFESDKGELKKRFEEWISTAFKQDKETLTITPRVDMTDKEANKFAKEMIDMINDSVGKDNEQFDPLRDQIKAAIGDPNTPQALLDLFNDQKFRSDLAASFEIDQVDIDAVAKTNATNYKDAFLNQLSTSGQNESQISWQAAILGIPTGKTEGGDDKDKKTVDFKEISKEVDTYKTSLDGAKTSVDSLKTSTDGLATSVGTQITKYNTANRQLVNTDKNVDTLKKSIDALIGGIYSFIDRTDEWIKKYNIVNRQLVNTKKNIDMLKSAIDKLPTKKTVEIEQKFTTSGTKHFQHGGSFIAWHQQNFAGATIGEHSKPELVTVTPLTNPDDINDRHIKMNVTRNLESVLPGNGLLLGNNSRHNGSNNFDVQSVIPNIYNTNIIKIDGNDIVRSKEIIQMMNSNAGRNMGRYG